MATGYQITIWKTPVNFYLLFPGLKNRDYLANVGGGQLLSTSSQNVFVVDNSYDHDNLLKTHLSCVAGENKLLIELQISLCVGYDGYQCVVGSTVHLSS